VSRMLPRVVAGHLLLLLCCSLAPLHTVTCRVFKGFMLLQSYIDVCEL
jgi:hypothetical protein